MANELGMTLTYGRKAIPLTADQVEVIMTFLEFHEDDEYDGIDGCWPYNRAAFDELRDLTFSIQGDQSDPDRNATLKEDQRP